MDTIFKKRIEKFISVFICLVMILGIFTPSAFAEEQGDANDHVIYVKNGDEGSTVGDGTATNPYESLQYAISKAKDGDMIRLTEKIVFRYPGIFEIDKAITIDGQNNILNFVGADLRLSKDVVFKNMDLKMIHETNHVPVIYVNGYEFTINNVSTKISDIQNDVRPMIVAGDKAGNPTGTHAGINIIGGSSETRFQKILVGNETGDFSIPANIRIDSEYAVVDNGIVLGGDANSQAIEKVSVISNSKGLKKIDGTHSIDNEVTLKDNKFYSLDLENIKNLTLSDNAELTVASEKSFPGIVDLKAGSNLFVTGDKQLEIGLLKGLGTIALNPDSSLNVHTTIQDSVQLKLLATEDKLIDKLGRVYVTTGEGISDSAAASIEPASDEYLLEKVGKNYVLSQQEENYTVNIADSIANGQINADKTGNLKQGDRVALTVAADKGYILDTLTVMDADAKPVSMDTETAFRMPASNVTVNATFRKLEKRLINITVTEPKIGEMPIFHEMEDLPEDVISIFSYWMHTDENGTQMTSSDPAVKEALAEQGILPVAFDKAGEYKYKVLFTIREQNKETFHQVFQNLQVSINGIPQELVLDENNTIASVEVVYRLENSPKEEGDIPETPEKRLINITVTEPKIGEMPTFHEMEDLPEDVISLFSYWMHTDENGTQMTSSDPAAKEALAEQGILPVAFDKAGEYKYKVLFTIREQNKE
ncbi:MAG: hypothetical protein SOW48_03160, partial [Peptoniphilaceae bacterium]|nr:hypothetical protein [Peptoniphilaceae bacterium]MDY3075627.1 hypothetical protein [Peptoniphilaceae bacterium]